METRKAELSAFLQSTLALVERLSPIFGVFNVLVVDKQRDLPWSV